MQEKNRIYIAIDLKSFYASVECAQRGLDALTTNLVVADPSRTEKTICLAVSPSLKALGISGRARLFEVVQKVRNVNRRRLQNAPGHVFTGKSADDRELQANPSLELDYVIAPPHMAKYMEISSEIYQVYLKYVAPEDIHVYSIDEVFMDVTSYMKAYRMSPRELAATMIRDVLKETGITATAGIAPNLFLCKVAMDIVAKHIPADRDGVRIACLDEETYRRELWSHRPLTDFWRVGRGYAAKLEQNGLYTMGDIARCSIGRDDDYYNEDFLYRLFGINAELLIDHAWGWEPCTIADIKNYRPENKSVGSGQVLQQPYTFEDAKLVVREMADMLSLDLLEKKLAADQLVLFISYDRENLDDPQRAKLYRGPVTTDHYGRKVPKPANGSIALRKPTSSGKLFIEAAMELYERIVDPGLLIRKINITANHVITEDLLQKAEDNAFEQMDLFTDYEALRREEEAEAKDLDRERKIREAEIAIKNKFGKNAILKGMNLQKGATARMRNDQIGGHHV